MQVKRIFTPKRTTFTIVCLYITLVSSAAPLYVVNRLEMVFVPEINITILGIAFASDREHVQKIAFVINNFITPSSAFILVVICTIVLVTSLKKNSLWHKSSVSSVSAAFSRNQRVAKMVVMISTLFIFCFIPSSIGMLAAAFNPDVTVGGKDLDIGLYVGGLVFLLESINASMNIFIYYHMSSRYREVFMDIFCKCLSRKLNKS